MRGLASKPRNNLILSPLANVKFLTQNLHIDLLLEREMKANPRGLHSHTLIKIMIIKALLSKKPQPNEERVARLLVKAKW